MSLFIAKLTNYEKIIAYEVGLGNVVYSQMNVIILGYQES